MRRTTTTIAISLTALVLLAVPAWAAPSFVGNAEADPEQPLDLNLSVPRDESIGPTTEVVVTAATGFGVTSCAAPVGWDCGVEGRRVTYTNAGLATPSVFRLSVVTPATPGTYRFPVVQRDAEGGSITWSGEQAPTVLVRGEAPPPEEPTDEEPPPAEEPPAQDDGKDQDAPTPSPTPSRRPASSPSPSAPAATRTPAPSASSTEDEDDSTDRSDDAPAPRRTEGRTSGSTLDISPTTTDAAEPTSPAEPVSAPDVAAPASPRTSTAAQDDGTTIAAGEQAEPSRGSVPWQQWVGGGLLLAGAATVLVRRIRAS